MLKRASAVFKRILKRLRKSEKPEEDSRDALFCMREAQRAGKKLPSRADLRSITPTNKNGKKKTFSGKTFKKKEFAVNITTVADTVADSPSPKARRMTLNLPEDDESSRRCSTSQLMSPVPWFRFTSPSYSFRRHTYSKDDRKNEEDFADKLKDLIAKEGEVFDSMFTRSATPSVGALKLTHHPHISQNWKNLSAARSREFSRYSTREAALSCSLGLISFQYALRRSTVGTPQPEIDEEQFTEMLQKFAEEEAANKKLSWEYVSALKPTIDGFRQTL